MFEGKRERRNAKRKVMKRRPGQKYEYLPQNLFIKRSSR
jgi:hypothetical protein